MRKSPEKRTAHRFEPPNNPTTNSSLMQFVTTHTIRLFVAPLACTIGYGFSNAQESPSAAKELTSISPDKKWEYVGGEEPKIVKAGTNDLARHLPGQGPGDVVWAPDSKRFAFNYGQGRTHQTLVYQLRNDQWVALDFPGDNDEFEKQPNDIVAGQLKKEGVSEKKLEKQGKFLRLIWSTIKVDRWLDSNTAIVHVSLRQVAARMDAPGEMDNDYGADLLYTLKFDASGKWKIVKTHRMSEKEGKEHQ
jgi:hypothetical protein